MAEPFSLLRALHQRCTSRFLIKKNLETEKKKKKRLGKAKVHTTAIANGLVERITRMTPALLPNQMNRMKDSPMNQ